MTFSTTIASTWRKADEILFQTEQVGNVKIVTWNSNHLTVKKAEHIAWYICATQIDIMFIQDTRLTTAMYKSISYKLKNLLGSETFERIKYMFILLTCLGASLTRRQF